MSQKAKNVVVVATGFAGLKAAKALAKSRDRHTLRTFFADKTNVKVLLWNVDSADLQRRRLPMQVEKL